MKIYLAARYSRREELCGYREELRALGHEVTSRWLDGTHQLAHDGKPLGPEREALVEVFGLDAEAVEMTRHFALEDIADLREADCIIAFTESPDASAAGRGRGGRHVEFGWVLGWNLALLCHGESSAKLKQILVVGPRENVFYCLNAADQYDTWTACAAVFKARAARALQ